MRQILIATLIFVAGCASTPEPVTAPPEPELPKASPPPGGTTVYRSPAPTAIKGVPKKEDTGSGGGLSCDTPLGVIPDGGKATGYLKSVVSEGEICISDIITCKDGKWSGQAIHPTCKAQK